MNNKTLAIVLLSVTATLLLLANIFLPEPTFAADAVKDRDYQMVSARIDIGGEALYVIDNRSGMVAVFSYDTSSRSILPRAVLPLMDVFGAGASKTGR